MGTMLSRLCAWHHEHSMYDCGLLLCIDAICAMMKQCAYVEDGIAQAPEHLYNLKIFLNAPTCMPRRWHMLVVCHSIWLEAAGTWAIEYSRKHVVWWHNHNIYSSVIG